jgi:predicted transposase YdaD
LGGEAIAHGCVLAFGGDRFLLGSLGMKTDKLFYKMLLTQPGAVAELVPGVPEGFEYEYKAVVVKEKELRLDGVLRPLDADEDLPLVFFEAQMQPDEGFYGRFFAEIGLYLQQYPVSRPCRGLLVLWNRSQALGSQVPYSLLLDHWVEKIYLEDLVPLRDLSPNLALLRLIAVPEGDVVAEGRRILAGAAGRQDFLRSLDLVEGILSSKFPELTVEEVRRMLDLKLTDLSETRFYKEVAQTGAVTHTLETLSRRFGPLTGMQQKQVQSLSGEQLNLLSDAMFDFEGLEDVERWLGEHVQNIG